MVGAVRFVDKERRRSGGIEYDDVQVAIIIDVSKGDPTARLERSVVESGGICNFFKDPVPQISEQLKRFPVFWFVRKFVDQR